MILRSALPEGWKNFIAKKNNLPKLCDASGHVLDIASRVLWRVRFGNALYRLTFIVVEKLSLPVLPGTKFLNRHVDAINCRKSMVQFTGGTLPIVGHHAPGDLWRDPDRQVSEFQDFRPWKTGRG